MGVLPYWVMGIAVLGLDFLARTMAWCALEVDGLDDLNAGLAVLGRDGWIDGAAVIGRCSTVLVVEEGGRVIPRPACKPGQERESEKSEIENWVSVSLLWIYLHMQP